MITYEDLIDNTNNTFLKKHTNHLQISNRHLDLNNPIEKWLAITYVYARFKGLEDYKARSFASELTLFITGEMFDTEVSLIYREEWLDSHIYSIFEKLLSKHNGQNKEFWLEFIDYLIKFYKSSDSWKYERVSKFLQIRVTNEEKLIFDLIPQNKPKQKFIYLLKFFDYEVENFDFVRMGGPANNNWSVNLTVSEYATFMRVEGKTKTEKFLNLLYYWYTNKSLK